MQCANLYLTRNFAEVVSLWAKCKRWGLPYGDWYQAPWLWVELVTAFDAEADYMDSLRMERHDAGD